MNQIVYVNISESEYRSIKLKSYGFTLKDDRYVMHSGNISATISLDKVRECENEEFEQMFIDIKKRETQLQG